MREQKSSKFSAATRPLAFWNLSAGGAVCKWSGKDEACLYAEIQPRALKVLRGTTSFVCLPVNMGAAHLRHVYGDTYS